MVRHYAGRWTPIDPMLYGCPMIDPKVFDELAQRLSAAVPSGVRELQGDVEKNLRAALQAGLGKLDLVTREEFDVQAAVLARSRQKLDELAVRVERLEVALGVQRKKRRRVDPVDDPDMDGG